MYKTFEAIYDNGRITSIPVDVDIKRARVLVTVVEDIEDDKPGINLSEIMKYKGILKNFPDGLEYQKKLRNEW